METVVSESIRVEDIKEDIVKELKSTFNIDASIERYRIKSDPAESFLQFFRLTLP